MKKKIMAVLLACALAAGSAVSPAGMVTVRAEEGQEQVTEDGFRYEENDEVVTITGYAGSEEKIVIPDSIQGKKVISIGDEAFTDCENLTSINIPSSIESIGKRVFLRCDNLTEILVDEKNSYYVSKDGVLCDKSGKVLVQYPLGKIIPGVMPEVRIPNGITSIGYAAFWSCKMMKVSIPDGVTSIGVAAFCECSSLTNLDIPTSVTSIENGAFMLCPNLTSAYSSGTASINYAGSQEQWKQIKIGENNACLTLTWQPSVIHYASASPSTVKKTAQSVTANDITETYGVKPFSLGAKSSGGTALSYAVSNPKVATVDVTGKVTIKGCGITDITITAAETSAYARVQKVIKLTVKPKKMTVASVKSTKKKTATVKWKKDKTASGYLVECATDKKFKKNKVKVTVGKNKTTSTTVKKLKAGKKYYVRICAYTKSGNVKVQGDWSKAKTVKVKK